MLRIFLNIFDSVNCPSITIISTYYGKITREGLIDDMLSGYLPVNSLEYE